MTCPSGLPYLGHSACNQFESLPSPHFQVLQGHASPAPTTDYAGDLEPAKKGWVIWHFKTKRNKKHYTIWSEKDVFFFNSLWSDFVKCLVPTAILSMCVQRLHGKQNNLNTLFLESPCKTWCLLWWDPWGLIIYDIKKSTIFELKAVMFPAPCYLRTAKHNPIVNLFYNLVRSP